MSSQTCQNQHEDNKDNKHPSRSRSRYTIQTLTTIQQSETEDECSPFFVHIPSLPKSQIYHLRQIGLLTQDERSFDIQLLRNQHVSYLSRALQNPLSSSFVSLDASRPWIIYWTLHALDLLDSLPCVDTLHKIVDTLQRCFYEQQIKAENVSVMVGGFGGGPQQIGHCATSYAVRVHFVHQPLFKGRVFRTEQRYYVITEWTKN